MPDMVVAPKRLRVLMNGLLKPVHVVEQNAKRDGMSAVVGPGDTIEWSCSKDASFTIAFVDEDGDPAPTPFSDWQGSSRSSDSSGKVSGQIQNTPADVVFKYDVQGPGGTLDPMIIIET